MEAILRHRGREGSREFMLRFKGYDAAEDIWAKERDLEHAQELLQAYKAKKGID